jgi:hypothetical protein
VQDIAAAGRDGDEEGDEGAWQQGSIHVVVPSSGS